MRWFEQEVSLKEEVIKMFRFSRNAGPIMETEA